MSPYRPFRPRRIDRLVRDLGIFGSVWHQSSAQTSKVRCLDSGLTWIATYTLSRSNVPTDRQITLWGYRNMIPARKFFLCRSASITSSHGFGSEPPFLDIEIQAGSTITMSFLSPMNSIGPMVDRLITPA
jgi:hypothetical protein